MNQGLRREILACLGFDGPVASHFENLQGFRSRDWHSALSWMHISGIALLFWERVLKLGCEDCIPVRAREALAASLEEHRTRVAAMMQEFEFLNRHFERAGIEHAVWKGFALIPDYCPDACLRPTYDYDYLISLKSWEDAQKLMQSAGYTRRPQASSDQHLTFERHYLPPHLSLRPRSMYAVSLRRKVELHLCSWDENAFRIILQLPERPLDRTVRRNWKGQTFYSLGAQDAFVCQAIHAFQHILHNWCRLGWFWEIAYFLEGKSVDPRFWEELWQFLGCNRPLAEVVALVVSLAAGLFHPELTPPVRERMANGMREQVALWLRRYGVGSALDNFSANKYAVFLYREFVQDEKVWKEIRNSRLLPLHRPHRVEGVPSVTPFAFAPKMLQQSCYAAQRLIHHLAGGGVYAWESVRWDWLRRSARSVEVKPSVTQE